MTLFVAVTIIVNIIVYMVNYTRDLCNFFDYIILVLNILALASLVMILRKEKEIIHNCKKNRDEDRDM